MPRPSLQPLPAFAPDRLLDRIAEALQVGLDPTRIKDFPPWTQRVMHILKAQFLPREFSTILEADHAIFAEGIAIALVAGAREIAGSRLSTSGQFAQLLAERLALDASARDVAVQVGSGEFGASAEFQAQVMRRLFGGSAADRRAFVEGLAIGSRLPELLDGQAQRGTTDATSIYLMLWFYWPEISKLNSIGQVAHALAPFFTENKNLAGAHWDERIRKLANRIGLSFRAKQIRRRKAAAAR